MTDPQDPKRPQTGATTPLTSDLEARIARAQNERRVAEQAAQAPAKDMSGWNRGMRLGSEFIAAILVGAGMGYLLDLWLHTSPWLLLVMLMVGFAAGVLNVIRAASEMNKAAPPPTAAMRVPDDEDDE
jgi:ATP synthase protein I